MQNSYNPSVPFEMKTTYGNQSSIQNFHPPTPVPMPGGPAPICAPTNAYSNSIATHAGSNYYMPMQFSSNYMVAPYGAPALAPPLGPAYSMNYSAQAPNHLQYYPQNNAIRPPLPPAPVSYGSHTANRGYENVKNKNSSAMGNYQVAHRSNNNNNNNNNNNSSSSIHHAPPVVPSSSTSEVLFCEPCDKEFSTASSFEAHCKTHEPCRHPGCTFSASKKVVVAHFHGAHGLYSGSGFKTIDVEGQKFRVLLGTSPEEVAQWRADRKRKFPTAATAASKEEALAELKNAGGILPTENTGNRKRNRGSADDSTVSNNKKKKNNNNKRNSDHQSHYMPAENTSECVNNSSTTQNNNDVSTDKNTTTTTTTTAKENELLGGEQASPGHTATGTDSVKRKNRCMHFGRGRCQSGDSCKYSHDFVPVVCQYFTKFACRNGSRCMNIHHGAKKGVKESKGSSDPSSAANNTSSNANSNSSSNSDSCSAADPPAKDNDDAMLQSPNQKDEPLQSSDVKQDVSKGGHEGEEEAGAGADKMKRSSSQLHTNTKPPSAPRTQPQKKKGGLQIPPPLAGGERGTLLRKLLESEIVSEESVVLQCLRYIVQSNFFNEDVVAMIPVTITNSTSTSLDTEMIVNDATTVASLQQ